jgi:hypothetical protein
LKSEEKIIIKYITDYEPLIRHGHRYIALYNHIYSEHIRGATYFEMIENGFVAIYKSYQDFLALIAPKTKEYPPSLQLSPNFVLKTLFQKKMPTEGIIIKVTHYTSKNLDILGPINNYFTRISPNIEINPIDPQNFEIWFKPYQGFLDYVNYLFKYLPNH